MTEKINKIFADCQALLKGHFILSSGKHSNTYIQCALVTQYPQYASLLADFLIEPFKQEKISVVLGPAVGGIVLAQEVAQAFWRAGQQPVRTIFCEREQGQMTFRRGFSLAEGERVLAVEDVITTGGSIKEAIKLAQTKGAEVVGVASLIDRSVAAPDFEGIPWHSLLKVKAEVYAAEECPWCKDNIPAIKPGSKGLK